MKLSKWRRKENISEGKKGSYAHRRSHASNIKEASVRHNKKLEQLNLQERRSGRLRDKPLKTRPAKGLKKSQCPNGRPPELASQLLEGILAASRCLLDVLTPWDRTQESQVFLGSVWQLRIAGHPVASSTMMAVYVVPSFPSGKGPARSLWMHSPSVWPFVVVQARSSRSSSSRSQSLQSSFAGIIVSTSTMPSFRQRVPRHR
mmetsp:Transcript_7256/g.32155  ORF Transcript_7256/g.32155 Transcript_7256/m.32155 type:complete len:203 (+) Transcript_7256:2671-3279(+)